MVALFGLIQPSQASAISSSPRVVSFAISAIGVVTSLLWLIITNRGKAFYSHWYEQLNFLEKQYLAPINIFRTADEYFAKGRIKIGDQEFVLDRLSRGIPIFLAVKVVTTLFIIIWITLLVSLFLT